MNNEFLRGTCPDCGGKFQLNNWLSIPHCIAHLDRSIALNPPTRAMWDEAIAAATQTEEK